MTKLIFDAHLDLSMNALEWNRDLTREVVLLREREKGQSDKPDRGKGTVSLPEMRKGKVGICVATLIARYVAPGSLLPGWHSPEQAWAQQHGAAYRLTATQNRTEAMVNKLGQLQHDGIATARKTERKIAQFIQPIDVALRPALNGRDRLLLLAGLLELAVQPIQLRGLVGNLFAGGRKV